MFVKSTIFKNKIISRSTTDIKDYFKDWIKEVTAHGYLEPKEQP
jgi:hypothetical protein